MSENKYAPWVIGELTFHTPAQAAERLGVSRQVVWGLIRRGTLLATLVAGYYLITGADLEAVKARPGRGGRLRARINP
jgi:excisionase family DNA binding protein